MSKSSPTIIDFDLRIFKVGNAYNVTAQTPESGLAENKPDPASIQDEAFQEKLRQIREEPFTTDVALLREVGEVLYQFLFQGQVRDLFQAVWSQHVQSDENSALRLRLNIDEAALELATLPWEMMYWQDVFLATQINTLVTRQLLNLDYGNIKSLQVESSPHVLIVIPGGSGLNTSVEEDAIVTALKDADISYHVLKDQVSLQDLDDVLAAGDYTILHFIGHARFGQDEKGELHGFLRFNAANSGNKTAEEDWVPETDLQSLLGNYKSIKLVLLNACHTGEIGEHPHDRGFWGVIPSLLRAGVPAVIAMQYAVRDDVAALFAKTFYKRLTTGKWAGHVDVAVTMARNACFLAYPDDRGFATPALYLRSRDGIIFDLQKQNRTSSPEEIECSRVPQPSRHLLHRYRNQDIESVIRRLPILESRLHRLAWQIDNLRQKNDLSENQQWHLRKYKKTQQELERELDELKDVLVWKRYKLCAELQDLRKRLQSKEEEKAALEKAGAYVSYDLKNEIFNLNERILKLRQVLQESDNVLSSA